MAKIKNSVTIARIIEYLKTLATTVKQNKADIAGLKSGGGSKPVWKDITTTWKQQWNRDQVGKQMRFTTSTGRVWSGIITQGVLFGIYVEHMIAVPDNHTFIGWTVSLTGHTAQTWIFNGREFVNPTDITLSKVEILE